MKKLNKKILLAVFARMRGKGKRKKIRRGEGYKGHDKYYQSLYNNFYRENAKDLVDMRNSRLNEIKDEISKLNSKDTPPNEGDIRKLNDEQKFLERQNAIDSMLSTSLHEGNAMAIPLANSLREIDDQHLFGPNMYVNMNRPNYNEMAQASAKTRMQMGEYMSNPINQIKMSQMQQMV